MLDTDFESADFENCHGLVMKTGGCEESARKMAKSLFDNGFCEKEIEKLYLIGGDTWVFVWPKGSSVQMPRILQTISGFPFAQADTLYNYLKNNEKTGS